MSRRRWSRSRPLSAESLESRLLLTASSGSDIGLGVESFPSEAAYAEAIVAAATRQWQGLFGQHAYGFGPVAIQDGAFFFDVADRVAAMTEATAIDASATNTQVAGVDEADLVETDGERVYALGDGRLSIVSGFSDTPALVGQFDLPTREQAAGMFLAGTRLTILTSAAGEAVPVAWEDVQSSFWRQFRESPHTTITVLEVSDPTAIAVVSRTRLDGDLVAARMVDGQLRVVMNHAFTPPAPLVLPADPESVRPTVAERVGVVAARRAAAELESPPWRWIPEGTYESEAAYVARVREQLVAAMHPKAYQLDASGVVTSIADLVAATSIDIPHHDVFAQLTTISAIDVAAGDSPTMTAVGLLTAGETDVFATAESVFVFDGHAGMLVTPGVPVIADWSGIAVWEPPVTDVARIDLRPGSDGGTTVALAALGSFEGTLLNRFAVGEQDGVVQAVVEQRADGHGVVVLEQQGTSLKVVGSLGGIAADEQLYAARIVDNRAYFVTFRFTDPLFVVDLSVPTSPQLLGELHVPGYADHLQPLDDGLLLAIGRDADEKTGRFLGLQVSLFDVQDPADPQLLHRFTFEGGRGATTPITGDRWLRGDGDPLALGFFPEQGVVTIPVTIEGTPWWWAPVDGVAIAGDASSAVWRMPAPPKQVLEVIHFDVETGIVQMGSIDHEASVERAVRVGERLVAVSASEVSVHDFEDVRVPLASVPLADQPHVPVTQPRDGRPTPLATLLEQGFPLFDAWAVQAIETVGEEEIAYARHVSGAIHRVSRPLGDAEWAGFAFERIGNVENVWLSPDARGRAAPVRPADTPPPVAALVSEAILDKLGLVRNAAGRLVRAG